MGNFISWIQKNFVGDTAQGEARQSNQPQSAWGLVSTLVPGLVISLLYLITFFATRRSQKHFYMPRTYLGSLEDHQRSPELPARLLQWFIKFWRMPDIYALQHQSLDSYLFLRYLRVCTTICFVSMCIAWPILIPVNITGGNGKAQLELLSYSNIDIKTNPKRLYAHAIAAWIIYSYVLYTITRECIFYINLRQAYLLSPQSAGRLSSRTVLFTCVPESYRDENRIRKEFGAGVKRVWVAGNSRKIDQLVAERDEMAMLLERSEIKFLKRVNKCQYKRSQHPSNASEERVNQRVESSGTRPILDPLRPTHRLGPLGLIGKRVDAINWSRSRLEELIPETEKAQKDWAAGNHQKNSSVFVEFHNQSQAQTAYQVVTHHHVLSMAPKYIGIRPEDVIWHNLGLPWWRKIVAQYLVYAFIGVLVIFWAVPVGIVGIVAQVSVLESLPFLKWLRDLPSPLLGLISSLLPSSALAMVMSLVPGILRLCSRFAGAVSRAEVELFTQNTYFLFQLIQVFLIRTITDTASTAIVQIVDSPTSVFSTLSDALPTSSNFYISYFIIQGFAIATDVMTQVINCIIFVLFYKYLARTPRAMYSKWTTLGSNSWGSIMPVHTCITIISVSYAVIAPFLLLWSTIGIGIFYQAYRYDVFFVSDTEVNTQGLIYPTALKQLLVGIYLAEVCLIGMFIASEALGPAVMTIIFLIFTVLYHITLNQAVNPLLYNLPCTLQSQEENHQGLLTRTSQAALIGRTSHPEQGIAEKRPKVATKMFLGSHSLEALNTLNRFLKPWIYADYWTLRQWVPHHNSFKLSSESAEHSEEFAYLPPSVTSAAPNLWIAEDPQGFSKEEIAASRGIINMTDEGCTINEKNEMIWDTEQARPPIWSEKIHY